MKPLILFFLFISSQIACHALSNLNQYDRVDCGDEVSEDYFYVLDSRKNRLPAEDFEILVRSGQTQSMSSIASTSKGCLSKSTVHATDTLLVKSVSRNEAQIVRPEQINGRTEIVLMPLPSKKPTIVCNHNLVDSTLFMNQFINFNEAKFLEFYNIATTVSLDKLLLDKTDQRPLLNGGTYDARNLARGRIYDLELQLYDFVYSNGSLTSIPCELDMDIPNLSAKLGDEIKEYRNYFGESYGVVDEGYELNFYIEGGLKSVQIDYCFMRVNPEENLQVNAEAPCDDLKLPVKSYASSEKGERFDQGFWLVFYRYKKGLLTKPWVSQKIMIRKVCESALFKFEELDRNYCTDISGNIAIEGLQNSGVLELKYASSILGQLVVATTGFEAIRLPNLTFASQLNITSNPELASLHMPQLKQVAIDFYITANHKLADLKSLSSLQRVGNELYLAESAVENFEGLENLMVVGSSLTIAGHSQLRSLDHLESLTTIGRDLWIDGNKVLTSIEGMPKLRTIGSSLAVRNNDALVNIHLASQPGMTGVSFFANPRLNSLKGFESLQSLGGLSLHQNPALASLEGFANLMMIGNLTIEGSPLIRNFKDLRSLVSSQWNSINSMMGLESLDGLQNITSVKSFDLKGNPKLSRLSGLENLQKAGRLSLIKCNKLESLKGLDSLSDMETLVIEENQGLKTLSGTPMRIKNLQFATILANHFLQDLMMLSGLESVQEISLQYNLSLASLTDLKNLKSVTGSMEIISNSPLKSLEGLSNLESVGGDLTVDQQVNLVSLGGLSGLNRVGRNLTLNSCAMTNLHGLEALKAVKGSIALRSNLLLTTLEGLSGLESVGNGFDFSYSTRLKQPCSFFKDLAKVSCRS